MTLRLNLKCRFLVNTEIGKIKEVVKQFNLNGDRKRLWLGKIESIDSKVMNESMPISLNHFNKIDI